MNDYAKFPPKSPNWQWINTEYIDSFKGMYKVPLTYEFRWEAVTKLVSKSHFVFILVTYIKLMATERNVSIKTYTSYVEQSYKLHLTLSLTNPYKTKSGYMCMYTPKLSVKWAFLSIHSEQYVINILWHWTPGWTNNALCNVFTASKYGSECGDNAII